VPDTLEKIAFDLARDALADQGAQVSEIRARAGPVLAGAAAAAGLLARTAFNLPAHSDRVVQVVAAGAGALAALVVLVGAVLVLVSRDMAFSVDAGALLAVAVAS